MPAGAVAEAAAEAPSKMLVPVVAFNFGVPQHTSTLLCGL